MYFKPAGTSVCLRDNSDFPAGNDVTLPKCHGFVVGDFINFKEEDGGHLDSGVTDAIAAVSDVSGPFVIKSIDNSATPPHFDFATKAAPSTLITLTGDGGWCTDWRRRGHRHHGLPTTSGAYSGTPTGLSTTP